jgi:lipopolysaccharide export system protein LptC
MTRTEFGRTAVAQLLASLAVTGEHPLRDWTQRARSTALETLRYTRFVRLMKGMLPIAAAAVVASVVAYSVAPRHSDRVSLTYQRMGRLRNDLAMIKPRLTGADAKGNPFTITAEAAIQDSPGSHRATLDKVDADLQLDGQRWLNASAQAGFFDMDAGTLKLNGGISLYTDSGYEIHTKSADVDIKKTLISGADKVNGHGPPGSFSADRFQIDRQKKHVKLSGHVHMVMIPTKVKR